MSSLPRDCCGGASTTSEPRAGASFALDSCNASSPTTPALSSFTAKPKPASYASDPAKVRDPSAIALFEAQRIKRVVARISEPN